MGRKHQAAKLKESVRLRQCERKDGTISLYLDIYQKGCQKNEFLCLYLIPEKTTEERQRNRQTLAVAEKVKSQLIIALQDHGLDNWNVIERSSMPFEEWPNAYDHEDVVLSDRGNDIRLAFELKFSRKQFANYQPIESEKIKQYTFIDTTFDKLDECVKIDKI